MLADYHVHSAASYDGVLTLEEYAAMYEAMGFDEICVTDHAEFPRYIPTCPDFAVCFERIDAVRPGCVTMRKGVEVTLYDDDLSAEQIAVVLHGLQPDFLIGSVHEYEGKDPYKPSFYEDRDNARAYADYLDMVLRCVKRHRFFNVLGHIAYPQKWTPLPDPLLRYAHAPDLLDAIFTELIGRGAGMEINTSLFRPFKQPALDFVLLKRYMELGGEILTIGSDAHRTWDAGRHIREARALAAQAGFRYFCTFKNQTPIFHRL